MCEKCGAYKFNRSTQVQKQTDLQVQGQPGLQSKFQNSQAYTEKPCLEERISRDGTQESVLSIPPGDSNALRAVALLWVAHDHHCLETQLLG